MSRKRFLAWHLVLLLGWLLVAAMPVIFVRLFPFGS